MYLVLNLVADLRQVTRNLSLTRTNYLQTVAMLLLERHIVETKINYIYIYIPACSQYARTACVSCKTCFTACIPNKMIGR